MLNLNNNLKVLRETEKAILVEVEVELANCELFYTRQIWFPKSQMDEDGFPKEWIIRKKAEELEDEVTSRYGYGAGFMIGAIGGVNYSRAFGFMVVEQEVAA